VNLGTVVKPRRARTARIRPVQESPKRRRLGLGDDRWVPPVSGCGQRRSMRAGWAGSYTGVRPPTGESVLGLEDEGERADLRLRATQVMLGQAERRRATAEEKLKVRMRTLSAGLQLENGPDWGRRGRD
jgi:hypothetical protein